MNDQPRITIGERHGWGDAQPFGIAEIDERQHIYIIGKTGSGKTTLPRNLILRHIALGPGVGVIDPHGDLAEELLNHIPPTGLEFDLGCHDAQLLHRPRQIADDEAASGTPEHSLSGRCKQRAGVWPWRTGMGEISMPIPRADFQGCGCFVFREIY